MKRLCVLVTVGVLAAGSAAQAADDVKNTTSIFMPTTSPTGVALWDYVLSYGAAYAENDFSSAPLDDSGAVLWPVSVPPFASASASVVNPSATGSAATGIDGVTAITTANAGPGFSRGWAAASQQFWGEAVTDLDSVAFDVAYSIEHAFSGIDAYATSTVKMQLWKEGFSGVEDPGTGEWLWWIDDFSDDTMVMESIFQKSTLSSESYYLSPTDAMLSLLYDPDTGYAFETGEVGYVLIQVSSEAATIPAPAAVVLGFIGTGLVGFLRRRVL